MARRSDHSRPELEALIRNEAHRQMEAVGFARFSAREVAKRIGYSIGTLYNVFGSLDRLLLAVNAQTFSLWTAAVETALAKAGPAERIEVLVRSYFDFARDHHNAWAAIYDHRLPAGDTLPDGYVAARDRLIALLVEEVRTALPEARKGEAPRLALSLLAIVHGHCSLALDGTFARLGETEPLALALARIREALTTQG
jgi:AcrR family transcriptional regulator